MRGTCNRERRQHVPDEKAAGIPHENRCGIEIEDEKAGRRRDHQGGDRHQSHVAAVQPENGSERGEYDYRNAAREAVQAVEQIDGVDDADNPDERQRNGDQRLVVRIAFEDRESGEVEAVPRADQQVCHDDLEEKLPLEAEAVNVVVEAENHHRQSTAEEREMRDSDLHGEEIRDEKKAHETDGETGGNRDASDIWSRTFVVLTPLGPVHPVSGDRQTANDRNEQTGRCKR